MAPTTRMAWTMAGRRVWGMWRTFWCTRRSWWAAVRAVLVMGGMVVTGVTGLAVGAGAAVVPLVAWVALVALVLGASCATSHQPGDHLQGRDSDALAFYPLRMGWGWAYEIERDGGKVLAPYAVAVRTEDSAVVRNGEQSITYAILPDGIARREGGLVGDYLLRSPVRKGTRWPIENGEAQIVESGLQVTLASSVYRDCALVEEVRREPDRVTRTTYCRGVGPTENRGAPPRPREEVIYNGGACSAASPYPA